MEVRSSILSAEKQLDLIRESSSLQSYENLFHSLFPNSGSWWTDNLERDLTSIYPGAEVPEDYYRLLALVLTQISHFGFETPLGQEVRANKEGWKQSIYSPMHMLALASYMGDLNTQIYPAREHWSRLLPEDLSHGVWGLVPSGVRNRKVPDYYLPKTSDLDYVLRQVSLRLASNVPILYPNKELNQSLAGLGFLSAHVENMPHAEFHQSVFPKVQEIAKGIFDPRRVFFPTNSK